MSAEAEQSKPLPPPWDRIFGLSSRVFVWGLLFSILYVLWPFFPLVFLTFVFAYILEHGSQGLAHRVPNRPLRVVLVTIVFLGTLAAAGVYLAPHFRDQASKLARNYPDYLAKIDDALDDGRENEWVRRALPPDIKAKDIIDDALGFVRDEGIVDPTNVESPAPTVADAPSIFAQLETYPGGFPALVGDANISWSEFFDFARGRGESPPDELIRKISSQLESTEFAAIDGTPIDSAWLRENWRNEHSQLTDGSETKTNLKHTIETLKNVAAPILGIGSAFLLSLIFSFLIVLDLPKLSRAVAGLANTKLGFIYDEVAENIRDFGMMLGRALEAQLLIAVANTLLTAIGLYFLGLSENTVFFATIVFFCSFIPVAGVFLSSTPICLEALSHDGFQLMMFAILMILIIHFIEAYFLNPKIFGHHLHMNAVLVLIVLTIAGKLFGVWGLILGLPVVNYFFGHAIRRRDRSNMTKSEAA